MKVICKGYKTCSSINCFHAVSHEHNEYEISKCINIKSSDCYCSETKSEVRKQKLKKINENILSSTKK